MAAFRVRPSLTGVTARRRRLVVARYRNCSGFLSRPKDRVARLRACGRISIFARRRNFTEADLPGLMEFLHRRGVKGYVTFNTLIFQQELADAEQYLRAIVVAGVDAAIVQDLGICRLIRRLSPDFPMHASTQMTVTSAAGVEFAQDLGCNLVVLARECSLPEIEKIGEAMRPSAFPVEQSTVSARSPGAARNAQLPLEV